MRCQKVRSCLSAYCKNELTDKKNREVAAHLELCSDCRKEYSGMKEMVGALGKLSSETVTEDFNAKLLSRIAEERFKETRAKAYLPKSAPLFGWQKILPVVATACLVLAFVFTGGISILDNDDNGSVMVAVNNNAGDNLDDDYLTVLPNADRSYDLNSKNQAFAAHTKANWEFNKSLPVPIGSRVI